MHAKMPVKDRAKGQWYSILRYFGIDDCFLNKRNGPCPLPPCGGGRDRYRWNDKSGHGEYYCTKCGSGEGFQLLMKLHGWTFPELARRIEEFLGDGATNYKPKSQKDPAVAIRKVMEEALIIKPGDEVSRYLKARGLFRMTQDLMFHPALYEAETRQNLPAMIAPVRNVNGVVISIHRTYLQAGEKAKINSPKKIMPPIGTVNGGAIRLSPVSSHIGVAEGIETAIAAQMIFDVPVWSVISANGLTTFELPNGVEEVAIFGDNDVNFTGQHATFDLARRLSHKAVRVHVHIPDVPGQDWADVLLERGVAANG